ncbi:MULTISPECIES: flagellar hook protein FlgE [Bartonella]|uniref:flagellar hook protein FlgE n=1 Tax=Bartonella TaxID=773 RepID=UPI0018DD3875|nr:MULTISPECIES: flagellar hook protein FlgE [Bartonella]MBH9994993.1 flagellar hook protein FlgE [Bartonella sp. P0291]MBH9996662.1 flagellar hook protein FlgE [Bartonella sp. M0192]MBH9998822.1 flagellar hook protein FlgE [Bartonella sp. M0191]MBI0007795.1 flagellar hook protein FlgE [Bartonella sp. M0193]MBI0010113.1 flagellar hook protein FlgE [Bartonella sp. M0176]
MGIYGMMRTGVAGMNAQANRLTGVADNVANVSTAGYKRTDTQFSDLVMPSTRNAYQSGGVTTTVRHDISMQGAGRGTGKPGDIMLEGNGFFRVQDEAGTEYLTRAGSFQRNGQGYLQNAAGFYLLDETGKRVIIKGGAGELMQGKVTENINLTANLQADKKAIKRTGDDKVDFDIKNEKSYHFKKSKTIYDEQGTAVDVDFYFTKTDDNTWEIKTYVGDQNIALATKDQDGKTILKPGTNPDDKIPNTVITGLKFDKEGNLAGLVDSEGHTLLGTDGEPDLNIKIGLDVPNVNKEAGTNKVTTFSTMVNLYNPDKDGKTSLTQIGANFTFDAEADGYAPGTYKGFSFGTNGEIQVSYSNSQIRTIGTVGLSTVTAPDSLIPLTGTVFQAVPEAGGQTFGHPGEGTFGVLRSGMLEESNADIGDELTDMIEAQRNYTANSKVFQTGSEVMDVIVNLKR